MKILFFGTPDFAIPSLVRLHESSRHSIEAVVSNQDKRRGRGGKTSPTPVKKKALELDLPVIEAGDDLDDESFYQKISEPEADLFVVVAFRILPDRVLEVPPEGAINLHASLLPKYRGAAPIHWAVMNGETETGCTVFYIKSKVDTGDIIKQQSTEIGPNETTGDVYERLKDMGAVLLKKAVDQIEEGEVETTPQSEELVTQAPKLDRSDCRLDFHQSAGKVHNKIRGLSPFPTAWTTFDGKRLNVYRSRKGPQVELSPGKFTNVEGELVVGCKEGTVVLDKVQPEGSKRIGGSDFLNGYKEEGRFR